MLKKKKLKLKYTYIHNYIRKSDYIKNLRDLSNSDNKYPILN